MGNKAILVTENAEVLKNLCFSTFLTISIILSNKLKTF